ncbi:MAG: glucose dehydrogenase [Planctomycetota bacterium]|nr:MAG: glucose dehydrogenase [Planctomycetota bacterium]
MRRCVFGAALLTALAPASGQTITTQPFVSGLSRPVGFVQIPNDPAAQVILQQGGVAALVVNGVLSGAFIDLTPEIVNSSGERGLLGLAFPSNYGDPAGGACNDCFYVYHTDQTGTSRIARYRHMPGNPRAGDPGTRELLFSITQPFENHNAGHMAFGPDGMLWIASGDGGLANDPSENAQNIDSRLGKILRIDVSSAPGFTPAPGNPFADLPQQAVPGDDLVWSYGWRNPWKFSFDTGACGTGAFIAGDVGQDAREEIDYEPAGVPGGRNYGWDCVEGDIPVFTDVGCDPADPTLTGPLHVVRQPIAQSITGGYVYRGAEIPALRGQYVFGDFVTGGAWRLELALDQAGEASVVSATPITNEIGGVSIAAFGRDAAGELYVIDYFGGAVRKIVRVGPRSDLNGDGAVNGVDITFVLSDWLDAECGPSDLNNDGIVNGADITFILSEWTG